MYRAFETLSEPMRKMLAGLTAVHDSAKAHGYRAKATEFGRHLKRHCSSGVSMWR